MRRRLKKKSFKLFIIFLPSSCGAVFSFELLPFLTPLPSPFLLYLFIYLFIYFLFLSWQITYISIEPGVEVEVTIQAE